MANEWPPSELLKIGLAADALDRLVRRVPEPTDQPRYVDDETVAYALAAKIRREGAPVSERGSVAFMDKYKEFFKVEEA
jgi:hypothetical protein